MIDALKALTDVCHAMYMNHVLHTDRAELPLLDSSATRTHNLWHDSVFASRSEGVCAVQMPVADTKVYTSLHSLWLTSNFIIVPWMLDGSHRWNVQSWIINFWCSAAPVHKLCQHINAYTDANGRGQRKKNMWIATNGKKSDKERFTASQPPPSSSHPRRSSK